MGDTETIDNLLDSAFEKLKQAESIPDKKTKASEHTNIGRTIEGDLGPKDDIESALTGILAVLLSPVYI